MRQARNDEEAVSFRLRSVVAGVRPPAADVCRPDAGLFTDQTPLVWSDVVTTWPDDADLAPEPPPPSGPEPVGDPADGHPVDDEPGRAGDDRFARPIDPSAWAAQREPWRPVATGDADPAAQGRPTSASALTSAGAFGGGSARLGLFDPGRRGVKALAAVAVVVVLIAAFLAWRARPRVDPVAAPLASATPAEESPARGVAAAASTGPAAEVVVSVGGKVGRPGLVRLPAGARVADAIAAAGGARPGTDVALLNLARKVVDGEQILVGVSAPPAAPPPGPAGASVPGGTPAGPVNLNTATLADLDSLPGVGPVLAQRILEARTARGGFRAVTDLRQVEGIGSARYEQLKDLVTV